MSSASQRQRAIRGKSCIVCYQRKVRCDGQRPCATCVKTGKAPECKDSPTREIVSAKATAEMMKRLKRYEQLLIAHNIPLNEKDDSEEVLAKDHGSNGGGKMIFQSGHPRFVESDIWNHLESELSEHLPSPGESLPTDDFIDSPDGLLFGRNNILNLTQLHPNVSQVLQLWQTFLANFYPLAMPFHAPAIQQIVSESISNLSNLTPNVEALLFSIYLCAVMTMSRQDCLDLMGQPKAELLSVYSNATQQALIEAQFLQSNDLTVLQAFTLYLLASRRAIHPQSFWLLTGIASRLAQTMGLHKEHGLAKLCPYEAEVRRRLFWQVMALDTRSAHLAGAKTDGDSKRSFDTKKPLNIHDSDLSPHMSKLPSARIGPTDMLFYSVRLQIGECVWKLQLVDRSPKSDLEVYYKQKSELVATLESRVEQAIIGCDRSIPIHLLTIFLARSAVLQRRLAIFQEINQQRAQPSAAQGHKEDDISFQLALDAMMYDHLTYSTSVLRPFLWHVETYFPFQALLVLLTGVIRREPSPETASAWSRIIQAYENHRELLEQIKSPLHLAVGSLTLKAWDTRISTQDDVNLPTPPVIETLRQQRNIKPQQPVVDNQQMDSMFLGMNEQFEQDQTFYGVNFDDVSHLLVDTVPVDWSTWTP